MSATATDRTKSSWTPARIFLAISAGYHIPLGIIGLAINQSFPLSSHAAARSGSDQILGVLATNGWHSLAALAVGAISVYFTARPLHAREAALGIGAGHVAVVLALSVQDPSTFLIASNGADQVIHVTTAVGGLASGLLTRTGPKNERFLGPAAASRRG